MRLSVTVCAFLAASLVPPAALALLSPLSGGWDIHSVAGTFILLVPFSVFAVIVLGLPTFLLLRRFAPGRWWWVTPVGFALGLFVAVVIRLPNIPGLGELLQMGLLGAASALVFWLIWRRGQTSIVRTS